MHYLKLFKYLLAFSLYNFITSYCSSPETREKGATRIPVDTIGFAQYSWQMDSIMVRVERIFMYEELHPCEISTDEPAKIAISPHDDYTYIGALYPAVISQIRSPLVILFGVAHRAGDFGLQDKIIFDRHLFWKGPYGNVPVSQLRESIMNGLDEDMFILHDSIHNIEHSLEALVPFLQYYSEKVEIIPILVPYMSYDRMLYISNALAASINTAAEEHHMQWGKDFSILISNDAVHYGDEGWGGNNYAPFGSDTAGYNMALTHEKEIITSTLCGSLDPEKIRKFCEYTVEKDNYKEYKWTWCGRYSIPFGLLTAHHLAEAGGFTVKGTSAGYLTSIDHPGIPVEDLGMGTTAPANIRHWVGYVGIVYK
jgi:AmmeMemoRadiSam system protein B